MKIEDTVKFGGSGIIRSCWDWVTVNIPKGSVVLEVGSGPVSTKCLSSCYSLYSIEDNPKYVGVFSSVYIYAPLVSGWYSIKALQGKLPGGYKLLLIDGPVGTNRKKIIPHLDMFDLSGAIILDDIFRDDVKEIAKVLVDKYGKKNVTPEDRWDGNIEMWHVYV